MEQEKKYARIGDTVKVHFLCELEDGTILESSFEDEPLEFRIGECRFNSSLEQAVVGMLPNEFKSVKIPSDKAFGPYIKELITTVKRDLFPQNLVIQVGSSIVIPHDGEQIIQGVVREISESNITMDTNHPLAGKDLLFKIQLLEIIKYGSTNPGEYNNLGFALFNNGKIDEAIMLFERAIELDSKHAPAYINLGCAYQKKGLIERAVTFYKKALEVNPEIADTYYNMGSALAEQGDMNEALTAYDKAYGLNNNYIRAPWAHCMSQIPIIYSNQSEIDISRQKYADELKALYESISLGTKENVANAVSAVGSKTPFYLSYQGLNDRDLQRVYGELVCKIMSSGYPEYAENSSARFNKSDQLRIGFVSGWFIRHSNWKIPIKGWIENINKKKFKLYGYYTGIQKDDVTAIARQCFNRFVEDTYCFDDLCRTIRNDDLDVLIYPEIGMDPITLKLASLKLAPIQCASWGHPDTSGLPTIDYYLSSDLMEPSDGDSHYTEKLIRLPNLSVYYTPSDLPTAGINLETFGLRQKSIFYLCCQSLFKYLPKYDEIYPRIAEKISDCQFIFISDNYNYVTEQFRRRIYQCFDRFGLRGDNYVVFLPRLDAREYNAINSLADIYLDSIDWSGCNSTFEAIANDLPVVTFPGELMRGRHSAAILTMMGIAETIALSIDEYIELAIRLGIDSEYRQQISEKTAANKQLVYRDRTCISALEDFLETVVTERF